MLCVCLPVRVVQGRPVLGRTSCREYRFRGGLGLAGGCPGADQRSRMQGKSHLTLRQRGHHIFFYRYTLLHFMFYLTLKAHYVNKSSLSIKESKYKYFVKCYLINKKCQILS